MFIVLWLDVIFWHFHYFNDMVWCSIQGTTYYDEYIKDRLSRLSYHIDSFLNI